MMAVLTDFGSIIKYCLLIRLSKSELDTRQIQQNSPRISVLDSYFSSFFRALKLIKVTTNVKVVPISVIRVAMIALVCFDYFHVVIIVGVVRCEVKWRAFLAGCCRYCFWIRKWIVLAVVIVGPITEQYICITPAFSARTIVHVLTQFGAAERRSKKN
jgi:hypothetical protein